MEYHTWTWRHNRIIKINDEYKNGVCKQIPVVLVHGYSHNVY